VQEDYLRGIRFASVGLLPIMCIMSLVFAFVLHKLFSQKKEISVNIWIEALICFFTGIVLVSARNIIPLKLGDALGSFFVAYSNYLFFRSCEYHVNNVQDRKNIPEVFCLLYGIGLAVLNFIHLDKWEANYIGFFSMLLHIWLFIRIYKLGKANDNFLITYISYGYLISSIIWLIRTIVSDFYNFGDSLNDGFINWVTLLVLMIVFMVKNVFYIALLQSNIATELSGAEDIIRQRDDLIDSLNDEKYKYEMASEAKSQFLANVSHELRTPLHGLIGMLSIALKSNISQEVKNSLDKAIYSAKSLLNILNEILEFAKIESGIMTIDNSRFKTQQVFDDVKDLFDVAAKDKNIDLIITPDPMMPEYLTGDFYKLRQVLFNLVGNAIKFTNTGYVKLLSTIDYQDKQRIDITFCVKDTGIGISEDKVSDVLLPFNQENNANTRSYQGVGLGLPISEKILSNLGSKLLIESTPAIGTEMSFQMTFKFNQITKVHTDSTVNVTPEKLHSFVGLRGIVAEDNPINKDVIQEYLNELQISASFVSNGQECLDLLESSQDFDFILMDIQMPVLDGLETTKTIRSNPKFENILIFGLSASAAQSDYAIALQSGMNDFLVKPFDNETLHKVLSKHIGLR
jgi:signal transduction histidine kinase/CheY-like chemotaxis protein